MPIPAHYQARLLDASELTGWFDWSLDFFTDPHVLQTPYVDITLQLDVTEAYQCYRRQPGDGSFFAFLVWNFMRTLKDHLSFKLRLVDTQWYVIENPPLLIPVAVGGQQRFVELVLDNVSLLDYAEFSTLYQQQLQQARAGNGRRATAEEYYFSHFFGNLPNLQFTGLTLHYRQGDIAGNTFFYFGKRYPIAQRLYIPLAVKLHHACTDPYVLDLLLQDLQRRIETF